MSNQKLELTWIGKNDNKKIEPRILIEDKEKSYGDENTENMLIHGDNLLALKALEDKFTNKIKCIYIDPPYNTGSAFEHYDDNLEHSIWLNLMKQRLKILHTLLKDDGTLWISIDDTEEAYLRILCDEIFGRSNFIANLPTIMNLKGNQDQFGFAGTHEYTIVYAKDKSKCKIYNFNISEEELMDEWKKDSIGFYKKGAILRATGEESKREDRPLMFYPILIKDGKISTITYEEFSKIYDKKSGKFDDMYLSELIKKYENEYDVVLPMENDQNYGRWRWGFTNENIQRLEYDVLPVKTTKGYSIYKKQRPELDSIPTRKPKTLMYKPEYSSGNGTEQIKKIFGYKAFSYPKPEQLISDFIHMSTQEGDFVLDSFLGSGTTCAVAQKMHRKWIGIELGKHCYDLCKVRLDKVIDGKENTGITKSVNWQGGGGYKFYELAPSLLVKDKFGNWIISEEYDGNMLMQAICKQEKFDYLENQEQYWKQGKSSENSYIYVTTNYVSLEYLRTIHEEMKENESLLICAKSYQAECEDKYNDITIKKIPQSILNNCEYGKENYNLNIVENDNESNEDECDE